MSVWALVWERRERQRQGRGEGVGGSGIAVEWSDKRKGVYMKAMCVCARYRDGHDEVLVLAKWIIRIIREGGQVRSGGGLGISAKSHRLAFSDISSRSTDNV